MEYIHTKEFLNNISAKLPVNDYYTTDDKKLKELAKLRAMLNTIFESYNAMKNNDKKEDIFDVIETIADMKEVWGNMS